MCQVLRPFFVSCICYFYTMFYRTTFTKYCKLCVRSHLNYGDLLYHRYDSEMRLGFTQRLEQTQYSAALAVSGAWKGTNRQRLHNELEWESLYSRRWYRRLCHFVNLRNNRSQSISSIKSQLNDKPALILAR